MLQNDPRIKELMYENAVKKLANLKGITLEESKESISTISFKEYIELLEASANITAPSGQSIGPAAAAASNSQPQQPTSQQSQQQPAKQSPQKAQVMWPGKGSPVEQGMTVGLKGPNGTPVPGEIVSVDTGKKGVTIRNPVTGQQEIHGMDDLQPFVAGKTPNMPNQPQQPLKPVAEELARLKHLAGIISEDGSGGGMGAGSMGAGSTTSSSNIAVANKSLGKKTISRKIPENSLDEYTPTVAKTIVGDTKPKQDSGKLSARLAKAGKPTATRKNNGFKK